MITRIYIDNYKSLVNFEYRPGKTNLLAGLNGSGKSSVFEVVEKLRRIICFGAKVPEQLLTESLTRWSARDTQNLILDVTLADKSFSYELSVIHHRQRALGLIEQEKLSLNGKTLLHFQQKNLKLFDQDGNQRAAFDFGNSRSFVSELELNTWAGPHIEFRTFMEKVGIFKPDPRRLSSTSSEESDHLSSDCSNFVDWYRSWAANYPERAVSVVNYLRGPMRGLHALRLVASGNSRNLQVELKSKHGSHNLSIDELSDGQKMMLILAGIAASEEYKTLLLDEPDNFLAPNEIQPVLRVLEAIEDPDRQSLIISHHPSSIDYLASRSACLLDSPDGMTRITSLADIDLDGDRLSELMKDGSLPA